MKTNLNLELLKKLYSTLSELLTTSTNIGNLLEVDLTEEKCGEYAVENSKVNLLGKENYREYAVENSKINLIGNVFLIIK